MSRSVRALVAFAIMVGAAIGGGATAAGAQPVEAEPAKHSFRTWSQDQAEAASPLVGSEEAKKGGTNDRAKAEAFADRAGLALTKVQAEIGSTFVAAAFDPVAGNRLVVRVTGDVAALVSPTLEGLDGDGGEVRIVTQEQTAAGFEADLERAQALVGTKIGGAEVLTASRDDLAGAVVVGVDADVASVQAELDKQYSNVIVQITTKQENGDCYGGTCTWGNNPVRSQGPIGGGQSLLVPVGTCTSAFTATKGGASVVITAGHCVSPNPAGTVSLASSPATPLGTTNQMRYLDGSGLDIAAINNGSGSSRSCIVLGNGTCRNIVTSNAVVLQGAPITKTGSTTGETSGVITSMSVNNGGAISTSAYLDRGDSGGVLYRSNGSAVDVLGINNTIGNCPAPANCSGPSSYTSWRVACPLLGVDNCPSTVPHNPFGSFDVVVNRAEGGLRASGWAIDPDWTSSVGIHFYLDGVMVGSGMTGAPRPDVAVFYPGYNSTGFEATLDVTPSPGAHMLCAYALNGGSTPGTNVLLGCKSISPPEARLAVGDYDGDGKTDRALVNATGQWFVFASSGTSPIPWGWQWIGMDSRMRLAVGDYDGDGKDDPAIVSPDGRWYVAASSGTSPIPWGWQWVGMGLAIPLALGDYDGDGKTDRAIVSPAGQWYVMASGGTTPVPWGWQGLPLGTYSRLAVGDYDGDGKTDRAQVSWDSRWYVTASSGTSPVAWGWQWIGMDTNSRLVLGDYDGDGKTDTAIVHPNGKWYVFGSAGGYPIPWGWQWVGFDATQWLAPGDYDGDGITDRMLVGNTADARWYGIRASTGTTPVGIPWGWAWLGANFGSHYL